MSRDRFTAILKYLSVTINGTEDALGQVQTDSQQYVMFSKYLDPCVNENIGETFR